MGAPFFFILHLMPHHNTRTYLFFLQNLFRYQFVSTIITTRMTIRMLTAIIYVPGPLCIRILFCYQLIAAIPTAFRIKSGDNWYHTKIRIENANKQHDKKNNHRSDQTKITTTTNRMPYFMHFNYCLDFHPFTFHLLFLVILVQNQFHCKRIDL